MKKNIRMKSQNNTQYLKVFPINIEVKVLAQDPSRAKNFTSVRLNSYQISTIPRETKEVFLDSRKIVKSGTLRDFFSSLNRPLESLVLGAEEILHYKHLSVQARQTGHKSVEILRLGYEDSTYALAYQYNEIVVVGLKRSTRTGFGATENVYALDEYIEVTPGRYMSKIIFPKR